MKTNFKSAISIFTAVTLMAVSVVPVFATDTNNTVTFHTNTGSLSEITGTYSDDFKVCKTNTDNTVSEFTDIPTLNDEDNNKYIFAGWYYEDGTPLKWSTDVCSSATDVYAHWIEIGTVTKDKADTKNTGSNTYSGFDLFGVQIRPDDTYDTNGNQYGGLRFVTTYSEELFNKLEGLFTTSYTTTSEVTEKVTYNDTSNKYGYLVAKTKTVNSYLNYHKSKGSLSEEQANSFKAEKGQLNTYGIMDVDCTEINKNDHKNFEDYRIFSMVMTYSNDTDRVTDIMARAYLTYTDANGVERTVYNNYTGTNTYGGCSTSYDYVNSAPDEMYTGYRHITVNAGDIVTYTINVKTDSKISSYRITTHYDSDVFNAVSDTDIITLGNTAGYWYANTATAGIVKTAVISNFGIPYSANNGATLQTIKFVAKESGTYTIYHTVDEMNDADLSDMIVNNKPVSGVAFTTSVTVNSQS